MNRGPLRKIVGFKPLDRGRYLNQLGYITLECGHSVFHRKYGTVTRHEYNKLKGKRKHCIKCRILK